MVGQNWGVDYTTEMEMKAYEVSTKVNASGEIRLPDCLLDQLPLDRNVRLIILVSEQTDSEEAPEWANLTLNQFFAGYTDADSVYDRI